ncbi:recombinase family protein [Stieleria magnilauensis]|uniref:Recombinase n=1 Tax=Stieleria magnilauensis TaxID=2527963 RepID=A0ABX5XT23_9BACT|nr:hypothetical protein TBK1r_35110 [Planctomycetes bacterium TBK1r]
MIAAYIRVSSDKQDVQRQRQSITDWAVRTDSTIGHWFEDSEGKNPRDQAAKRPEFQKLLKAVESGLIRQIIVDSQDRFGTKDVYQFGQFVTLLRENNCELWSVSQGNLTADDDATILTNTIGALTSTREQKEKATRSVGGLVKTAKAGLYPGGVAPYGLDVVCFANGSEKWRVRWHSQTERTRIYPDGRKEQFNGRGNMPASDPTDELRFRPGCEKRLGVIRQIFGWYATEDISPHKIATRLNDAGIVNAYNNNWNKVGVRSLLANPVYVGLPAWNKRGRPRFKEYVNGQIQDVTDKKTRRRDPSEFVQPDSVEFEPIVTGDVWDKVQEKLSASSQKAKRPSQVANLWLKRFLVCGGCGKPMVACAPQGRTTYGSYICGNYNTFGKENPTGCRCHRVKHSVLEALVEKYLEEVDPQLVELAEPPENTVRKFAGEEFNKAYAEQMKLWARMTDYVPDDWVQHVSGDAWTAWLNIHEAYEPPNLDAEIDAKEQELDAMLSGFARLSPALQDRANAKMEGLQTQIEALKAEAEDLAIPYREVAGEVAARQKALRHALTIANDEGPARAEALRGVVDSIVVNFRYTAKKSFLDCVEIFPVAGEKLCLALEGSPGPN